MFRTERQRELSHFVAELKCIITEKCMDYVTDEEIEYIYSALAANLMNDVVRWTYEDLKEINKDKNFPS